ncbi:MAG: hypothetical protein K0U98_11825 [Deltaproteobacteria bacterium]|nr:hypothetical protein [Deltaproteobacteria bacterium]
MTLSPPQIDRLLAMIAGTRTEEMSCDPCLAELAELVESERANKPSRREIFAEVRHHLTACGECREEYETLLAAVAALEAEG